MADAYQEVIRISADDQTAAGVKSAESRMSALSKIARIPLTIIDKATAPLRSVMDLLGKIGLASMGLQSLENTVKGLVAPAMDFQTSFAKIGALTTSSAADLAVYKTGIEDVSHLTGISAAQLSDAVFFIASAGQTGAAAIQTLTASAKASAAGLGDTKTIADAVTSALNAYKLSADQATHVTDLFTNAVTQGKMAPGDLAGELGKIMPIAQQAGVGLDQVLASMATMTRVGLSASEAATAVRGTLQALEIPKGPAVAALAAIGMSAADLRKEITDKGLLAALSDLMTKTGGNLDQIGDIIPNVRALTGVLATAGSQADTYAQIMDSMGMSTGRTDAAFQTMSETFGFKMDILKQRFEEIQITVGDALMPMLAPFVDWLGNTLPGAIDALQPFFKTLQGVFDVLGQVIMSFSGDAGRMGLALDKVGDNFGETAKAGIQPFFQGIMETIPKVEALWSNIQDNFIPTLERLYDWLAPKLGVAIDWFVNVGWPALSGAFTAAYNYIENTLVPGLTDLWTAIWPTLQSAFDWWTNTAWPNLQTTWEQVCSFIATDLVPIISSIGGFLKTDALPWAIDRWNDLHAAFDTVNGAMNTTYSWLLKNQVVLYMLGGALGGVGVLLLAMGVNAGIAAITLGFLNVVTWLAEGAWIALDAAMTMNPIGLIVVGIGILIGVLVWAYNNVGWFHDLVNNVFGWIANTAVPWLVDAFHSVMQTINDLWAIAQIVGADLGKIFDAAGTTASNLRSIFMIELGKVGDALNTMWATAKTVFTWIMNTDLAKSVGAMFNALGTAIHNALTSMLPINAGPFHLTIDGFKMDTPQLPDIGAALGGTPSAPQLASGPQLPSPGDALLGLHAIANGPAVSAASHQQEGGWLREPIIGVGMDTGRSYSFVENRKPEYVIPAGGGTGGGPGGRSIVLHVEAGAVQVNGADGPAQGWADAADALWADLYRKLQMALQNQTAGA